MTSRPLTVLVGVLCTFSVTAAQAQNAAKPCISAPQAEALILTLAPQLLAATAATCTPHLSTSAYLRRPVTRLTAKYSAEEGGSWPLAKEALKKLTGPDVAPMLDSELARPMIGSLAAPIMTKEIKPADCPAIDRVLSLVDPLPARNTAALIVTIIEISGRSKKLKSSLTVCPPTAPVR